MSCQIIGFGSSIPSYKSIHMIFSNLLFHKDQDTSLLREMFPDIPLLQLNEMLAHDSLSGAVEGAHPHFQLARY